MSLQLVIGFFEMIVVHFKIRVVGFGSLIVHFQIAIVVIVVGAIGLKKPNCCSRFREFGSMLGLVVIEPIKN